MSYLIYNFVLQDDKQLELQLFKLFYNERDIDELADEINRKNTLLEKETRRRDKIDDEIKEKKKEQGRMSRDLTKVEQSIRESVSLCCFTFKVIHSLVRE